ncbi:conserved hypothetical protein [Histoplasma capsulatum G186AR]|uniref:Cytochrome b5 heme-binding domain-containing protein n=2 Tax=Ajellomyces capsulatus TaxID=5037 RepID=C0NEF3_AJECG|nr:uncharacterized protein HCBG_01269 [Histoplasma capsulatum G186AR]EEH09624.1 conserved hypothetical protein [Histoplasma capsulatum G186AR]KAG5288955.1 heme/steroid binding domain-containing protein [Histoplasma capsulatum]QSS73361.1 heme/steroid binding domain-containing protein [Histoplasma capsulatum G186AR]
MAALRQRPGKGSPPSSKSGMSENEYDHIDYTPTSSGSEEELSSGSKNRVKTEDADEAGQSRRRWSISVLDLCRVIFLLVLTSCALSYYITTDSVLWGYKPKFLRWAVVKTYLRGPLELTPTQLALYNGTDPSLPIYVAVDGVIFDVSANPRIYGKGGSYNSFAGADATRAYVTGCFSEDRTPDIRGVELMYIPVEDDDENPLELAMSKEQKQARRKEEWNAAVESVSKQVMHWKEFFANHQKYVQVGRVVGIEKLMQGPERELCQAAQKMRPLRSKLNAAKSAQVEDKL